MIDLLLPYLVAVVSFALAVIVTVFSQQASESARRSYQETLRRVPEFLRYTDFRAELDELELRLADRRDEASRAEALIEEANTKRQWLAQNEEAIQQAEKARRDLEQWESELTSLVEQVSQKEESLRKVQDAQREAEFACKAATQQSERATKDLEAARSERGELLKQVAQLTTQVDQVRNTLSELQGHLAQQQVERQRLDAEIQRVRDELSAIKSTRSELSSAVKALEAEKRELSTAVAGLEARSKAMQERVAVEGGGVGSVEDPLDEVKVPAIPEASLVDSASNDDEVTALESLKTTLRDEGLQFHPRVIDAFHTALKTQNESPLLVLAGISGTGKSLLPQRYAQALGMHSLMVPVQPRWDSPQDLLGFFNYLEGRYKPTELTRALVQFDEHTELLGDQSSGLSDRMLLVLLDEMNLARVEYYFSEFLSRLESRRGLRADDSSGRKRASLTVEVGAAGGTTTSHDIFVGNNVLFVGTINEDESTQTLSDKVVDRANVMRFGRPARLSDPAAAGPSGDQEAARGYLTRATWARWIEQAAPLDSATNKMALDHVSTLNEALKEIGRPFAYRTRDAIIAYLRHYPNRSDKRIKLAIADQIEQRVLPKMRGIDPSEPGSSRALRSVKDLAADLGDGELAEAIEEGSRGGHGHSFMWHGVDRAVER